MNCFDKCNLNTKAKLQLPCHCSSAVWGETAQNPGRWAEDVHLIPAVGAWPSLETWEGKGVPLGMVIQETRESCDKSAGQLNWEEKKKKTQTILMFSLITGSVFSKYRVACLHWMQDTLHLNDRLVATDPARGGLLQKQAVRSSRMACPSCSPAPASVFLASLNNSSCALEIAFSPTTASKLLILYCALERQSFTKAEMETFKLFNHSMQIVTNFCNALVR